MAMQQTRIPASELSAIGITNQRETTVVWNPKTGTPWYDAIVWQDTRTDHIVAALQRSNKGDVVRKKSGLTCPHERVHPLS